MNVVYVDTQTIKQYWPELIILFQVIAPSIEYKNIKTYALNKWDILLLL